MQCHVSTPQKKKETRISSERFATDPPQFTTDFAAKGSTKKFAVDSKVVENFWQIKIWQRLEPNSKKENELKILGRRKQIKWIK